MNLQQKFYYTLCSLNLIAPLVCYSNSKLVTIPETITVRGTVSPELREFSDHFLQEMHKRSDESLEKITQNFRILAKETVESTTKSTKELTQQLIDGGIPVKVNITSEDIKNALTGGNYTLKLITDPDTMVGIASLSCLWTSIYQLNKKEKPIQSQDVVIPAALAGIGFLYLILKNGQAKPETKPVATTSATSTAQPAEPKSLLAQRPEIPVVSEEIKKEPALKALTQTMPTEQLLVHKKRGVSSKKPL